MSQDPPAIDMDEGLLARLISRALGRGGDYADVFVEREHSLVLRWEEGRVKEARRQVVRGAGIRVLAGNQTGYAYTEELDEPALLAVADTAAHIARGGSGESADFTENERPEHYAVERPLGEVALADKVALLARIHETAAGERGVEKVQASYAESQREILIANSEGALLCDRQPLVRLNASVVFQKNGRRESAQLSDGGRVGLEFFDTHPVEELAREVLRMAALRFEAIEMEAGPMPVVLGAATSGVLLHEAVGHGLEADFNARGTSKFTGRVGEKVASELCTIVDDPSIPGDRGAINIDDEGSAVGRSVLIEDGVLRGYLHDRISARQLGTELTGNGRRESYRHHPQPRMTCTYLLPGDSAPEEIIGSVRRGFYAKNFSGGQVDIARGDFVFNVTEGYRIEDGRVTAPVKGATLIGNGPDIMGKVSMVGNDFELSRGTWTCGKRGQYVPVNVGQPHVKISEITVGGTRAGAAS